MRIAVIIVHATGVATGSIGSGGTNYESNSDSSNVSIPRDMYGDIRKDKESHCGEFNQD